MSLPDLTQYKGVCPVCQGRGNPEDPPCKFCDGSGIVDCPKKDDSTSLPGE